MTKRQPATKRLPPPPPLPSVSPPAVATPEPQPALVVSNPREFDIPREEIAGFIGLIPMATSMMAPGKELPPEFLDQLEAAANHVREVLVVIDGRPLFKLKIVG